MCNLMFSFLHTACGHPSYALFRISYICNVPYQAHLLDHLTVSRSPDFAVYDDLCDGCQREAFDTEYPVMVREILATLRADYGVRGLVNLLVLTRWPDRNYSPDWEVRGVDILRERDNNLRIQAELEETLLELQMEMAAMEQMNVIARVEEEEEEEAEEEENGTVAIEEEVDVAVELEDTAVADHDDDVVVMDMEIQ